MATQKIKNVDTETSLNYIYGRQNNDIVQALTTNVTVGGLNATFSKTGISSYSSRGTVTKGGVTLLGNICFVDILFRTASAITPSEYVTILTGLPTPASGQPVALSAVHCSDEVNYLCSAMVNASGTMFLYCDHNWSSGYYFSITGCYAV